MVEPDRREPSVFQSLRRLLRYEDEKASLKRRAAQGSLWEMSGRFAQQGLRLAGNLILTRLLFPEAFGLMAMVNVVIRGIQMFSDVGIRGSIISDRRGDDPRFLNTAWTFQICRGFLIWLATCVEAWFAARVYGAPELLLMIPVAGLNSAIGGFRSFRFMQRLQCVGSHA